MLVNQADIQKFIPQRPPMVMVGQLLNNSESASTSQFKIEKDNIFCSGGYFTEPGIIENMAQSAALRAGFEANQKNEKVKVGFIGAIKKLSIYQLPAINTTIKTTITITNNFGNITLVKSQVYESGLLIAEAEMSIFMQGENQANES